MKQFILVLCGCLISIQTFAVEVESTNRLELKLGGDCKLTFIRISPKIYGVDYPDYFVSETEVTNANFKCYLDATMQAKDDMKAVEKSKGSFGTAGPIYKVTDETAVWRDGKFPKGLEDHPVALVTLADATQFCEWLSKENKERGLFRLPTWNEWMVAAYGSKRKYPWGDQWDPKRVHASFESEFDVKFKDGEVIAIDTRPKRTEPVKARPAGRSPEGLFGMLGNAEEYIVEADATGEDYFGLGSRWMGGGFTDGALSFDERPRMVPPRQDYWGYGHSSVNQCCDLGFRVVLDPSSDKKLIGRTRVFKQNNKSWMTKEDDPQPSPVQAPKR